MEALILAAVLGFISVAQAGLNRDLAVRGAGLGGALLANNLVLCVATLVLLAATGQVATIPRGLALLRPGVAGLRAWLPGLLGIALVAGIPFGIARYGAARVFIPLVGAQVAASVAWDAWMEGGLARLAWQDWAGAGLGLAALVLVNLRSLT